jgi:hypothetical protein
MDDQVAQLKDKLDRLLREAAEIEVRLAEADGTVQGVCHFSVIEARAHELGRQLSRSVQERQLQSWSFREGQRMNCPTCGTSCELGISERRIRSIDGSLPAREVVGYCPVCRRDFFPSA